MDPTSQPVITATKTERPYLLFLDIETTGLVPGRDQILEIGAIAVDRQFEVISTFDTLVHSPYGYVMALPDVRAMHIESGLWADLAVMYPPPVADVDRLLASWLVALGFGKNEVVIAGHSVAFDQGFLKGTPGFDRTKALLSHRTFDTSVLARILKDLDYPIPFKKMPHRGLEDCQIELDECRAMFKILAADRAEAVKARKARLGDA